MNAERPNAVARNLGVVRDERRTSVRMRIRLDGNRSARGVNAGIAIVQDV